MADDRDRERASNHHYNILHVLPQKKNLQEVHQAIKVNELEAQAALQIRGLRDHASSTTLSDNEYAAVYDILGL